MVATARPSPPASAPPPAGRMAAVQEMARRQRILFEVEREFIRDEERHAREIAPFLAPSSTPVAASVSEWSEWATHVASAWSSRKAAPFPKFPKSEI